MPNSNKSNNPLYGDHKYIDAYWNNSFAKNYWAGQNNLRKKKPSTKQIEDAHPKHIIECLNDNTLVVADIPYWKMDELEQYQRKKFFKGTPVNDYHQYIMSLTGTGLEAAANDFMMGAPLIRSAFAKRGLNPALVDDFVGNTQLIKGLKFTGEVLGKGAFVFCVFNSLSVMERQYHDEQYFMMGVTGSELIVSAYATFAAGPVAGLVIGGAYLLIKLNIAGIKQAAIDAKQKLELDKIKETGYLPYMLDSRSLSFNQGY